MWVWSKIDKNWCSIKYFLMHVAPSPRIDFFYEARRMPSMPISISSVHGAVGCPPLPAIFRLKLICPFYFFPIIAKVHKAAGVSRKATKPRQKRFLSILLDYWISTAKFIPLYGKERSLFWPYYTTKRKNTAQKRAGQPFIMLLAYGNQHSFHFLSFRLRRSSMHAFSRSC